MSSEEVKIESYRLEGGEHDSISSLNELDEYEEELLAAGIDPNEEGRSGSFLQQDHSVVFAKSLIPGLEIMSTDEAIKKYSWLDEYFWNIIPANKDIYTKEVAERPTQGYFLRAEKGAKITLPLQSCLFISKDNIRQNVHNIVIAEEDSELNIITGCTVSHKINSALHLGVSEFYVKKNAKITFTMVHNWSGGVDARPRSATLIEDNGVFISNYIFMTPVRSIQMYPTAYCAGENSRASFQSIIYAQGDTNIDSGSRIVLQGKGSRGEIISRAIATDNARILARGELVGEAENVRGHLECRGLMLSDSSAIESIPELKARRKDIDLSHEAAVGKIAEEEIRYLMARGFSEDEAVGMIIRGFLSIDIKGLPEGLARETKKMFDMTLENVM
ncbi:MAG: cysteine desulfurase activator complex subunit SufB [Candidatus Syntrophoarchaeum sp. GoM_oil]|nr:MAG: cysteine desulfurase activator complex subunit SufB [Candidatus Syntrophoarchaeum sp. GoM_oil]